MRGVVLIAIAIAGGPGCGAPASRSITPASGGQAGGITVRIEADELNLHGPLVVYFGPRSAKGIVIESRWLVTAVVPQSDTIGPVDVQLRFGDGTQWTLPAAFTYEEQAGIVLQPEI